MIFPFPRPRTATAVTIVFNWDMVSFVPLLGIQIGVVSLVGRYMGAGRPEIAERVTRSGLKMGWSYSSVILVLFVGFPEQLVAVFQPGGRPHLSEAVLSPPACDDGRPLRPGRRDDGGSAAPSGAGDTFWTMCISVGLHGLRCQCSSSL